VIQTVFVSYKIAGFHLCLTSFDPLFSKSVLGDKLHSPNRMLAKIEIQKSNQSKTLNTGQALNLIDTSNRNKNVIDIKVKPTSLPGK
jgi:hypothetical protein